MSNDIITAPNPTVLTEEMVKELRQVGKGKSPLGTTEAMVVNYYSDLPAEEMYNIYVCITPKHRGAGYSDVTIGFPAIGRNEVYALGERVPEGSDSRPVRFVAQERCSYWGGTGSISALRSIANLVKVGDQLVIKFIIGNSTKTLEEAGLRQDEAYISIQRKGALLATFPVDVVVVPVDNLYSMIDRSYKGAQR